MWRNIFIGKTDYTFIVGILATNCCSVKNAAFLALSSSDFDAVN
jgi:hypothetical protein